MKTKLNLCGWIFGLAFLFIIWMNGTLAILITWALVAYVVYRLVIKPRLNSDATKPDFKFTNPASKSKQKMPDSLAKKLARRNQ